MENAISGFWCNRQLSYSLGPILKKWVKINSELAIAWKGDIPWACNERASISIFAGAVWKSNNIAFEEYSDIKNSKGNKIKGRVDIYFTSKKHQFIGEAKRCWSAAAKLDHSKTIETIYLELENACKDVRKIKPDGNRRLGIVFVHPVFRKSRTSDLEHQANCWLEYIKYHLECDALGWVFPKSDILPEYKGAYLPGTAIVIKEIK